MYCDFPASLRDLSVAKPIFTAQKSTLAVAVTLGNSTYRREMDAPRAVFTTGPEVITAHLSLFKRTHTHTRITHALHLTTQSHYENIILRLSCQLRTRCNRTFGKGSRERGVSFPLLESLSRRPLTTHSETRLEVDWCLLLMVGERNTPGDLFFSFLMGSARGCSFPLRSVFHPSSFTPHPCGLMLLALLFSHTSSRISYFASFVHVDLHPWNCCPYRCLFSL